MADVNPRKMVNVHEAKTHFSRLLDRAHAGEYRTSRTDGGIEICHEHLEYYSLAVLEHVHQLGLGISTAAQVGEVLEKLHYDFYYIKNFSFWLDLLILAGTIRVMLTGYGAR